MGCEEKKPPQTEGEFIEKKILTTGMDTRVNGIEDLLAFSAQQALIACQQDCDKLKQNVAIADKKVTDMTNDLLKLGGLVGPPPPPCPCKTGNCLWHRFGLFSYFVDLKKFSKMPEVEVQTLNGKVLSSSVEAEVLKSPKGQYAVVNLPQTKFDDKAVKMVIKTGNNAAEVLVNIK